MTDPITLQEGCKLAACKLGAIIRHQLVRQAMLGEDVAEVFHRSKGGNRGYRIDFYHLLNASTTIIHILVFEALALAGRTTQRSYD